MNFNDLRYVYRSLGKWMNYRPVNVRPRYGNTHFMENENILKEVVNYVGNPVKIRSSIQGMEVINEKFKIKSPIFNNETIGICYPTNKSDLVQSIQNTSQRKIYSGNIETRINSFMKASKLMEYKYYDKLLASIIVNQGKNLQEAELDITELIDFIRYNVMYVVELNKKQPTYDFNQNTLNVSEYIPLDGFVSSITPYNFSAIAGNLACLPAILGNTVSWKPSPNSLLSNRLIYDIFLEAGMSPQLMDFVIYDEKKYFDIISNSSQFSGLLFTGSSNVFSNMYKQIGQNIEKYNNYPRIIGETGGKNFHFIDKDCDIDHAINMTFESAFNYCGQKCSACSRVYIPKEYLDYFLNKMKELKSNIDSEYYSVINQKSYEKGINLIKEIKGNNYEIYGGKYNNVNSYYIEPTIVVDKDHTTKYFQEEFFLPILFVYPYENRDEALDKCHSMDYYALTGSIFGNVPHQVKYINDKLKNNCGNLYINDKSTGAVVGHQPFGGFKKSGTNDKAGDINMLYKLVNQKNIKVNLNKINYDL